MSEKEQVTARSRQSILAQVLEELGAEAVRASGPRWNGRVVLPSRDAVLAAVEGIRQIFFPGYFGTADLREQALHYHFGATLDRVLHSLEEQITRAVALASKHDFATCAHCRSTAGLATWAFLARLPEVRRILGSDVQAAFDGDPALQIKEEAIFSYPGIYAVTEQRLAHELFLLGVPLIPRIISEHAHSATGIDIHPGAQIGHSLFIDHGTGVVIGETTRIGDRVRIYQGVTLGALSLPRGAARKQSGQRRHPTIEDDVIIYANATILGGSTVIGRGAVVGGNSWVTQSVPRRQPAQS